MKYPHWFCYVTVGEVKLPFAAMLRSEGQASCAVTRYFKKKEVEIESQTDLVLYDSFDEVLQSEGLAKSDVTILTDDDRGKCIAFTHCDEPGGRCQVEYYDCGCFI